jgi:hypothetical protein
MANDKVRNGTTRVVNLAGPTLIAQGLTKSSGTLHTPVQPPQMIVPGQIAVVPAFTLKPGLTVKKGGRYERSITQ